MRRRGPPFRFFSTREKSETKGEPTRARRAPRDDVARNAPPFFGGDERLFDSSARDARPRSREDVRSPSSDASKKEKTFLREGVFFDVFGARARDEDSRTSRRLSSSSDTSALKNTRSLCFAQKIVTLHARAVVSRGDALLLRYRSAMVKHPRSRRSLAYQGMGRNSSSEPSEICSWSTK